MDDDSSEAESGSSLSRRAFLQGVSVLPLAAALVPLVPAAAQAEPAAATLVWHGQATTEIRAEGKRVFIDAFFAQNPAGAPREDFDLLLLTHGHADHFGQTLALLRDFSKFKLVANSELVRNLVAHGLGRAERVIDVNMGGKLVAGRTVADGAMAATPFPDVGVAEILMLPAVHTSSLRIPLSGTFVPAGASVGYVIRFRSGFTLYHAGDTYVFDEMRMIGKLVQPDLALVPIGGNFTMDPVDAARAVAEMIRPRFVIPVHYAKGAPAGTFSPALYGTPDEFVAALEDEDVQVRVPARGQAVILTGAGETAGVRVA